MAAPPPPTRPAVTRPTGTGPPPGLAVGLELARAAGAVAALPFHLAAYLARRERLAGELADDLASSAEVEEPPEPGPLPARPLRVFLSCAEASGEGHARHLLAALRSELARRGAPPPAVLGFGGPRLAEDGVRLVGDPVSSARMGLGVVRALPFYLRLLAGGARALREERPDLLLCVDSPALHVPLGHLAHRYGVPVVHHVTPQYWGWAPWRVAGYRRAVDLGLSILPFEPRWFARHGVRAAHVGHPIQDALAGVAPGRSDGAGRRLVVLPGSRASVLARNLPWMLDLLERFRARHPDVEVVLPHARPELVPTLRAALAARRAEWVRLEPGKLHEVLAGARAALSVSGTVLLDLLHHRVPTVVLYRLSSAWQAFLAPRLLTVPHFASPNLLAAERVCPEFCFAGAGPRDAVLAGLEALWEAGPARDRCLAGLDRAAARLGPAGADRRAAAWALAEVGRAGGARP